MCHTPAAAAEPGEKRLHSVRSTSDVVLNFGGSCGKVVEMRRRRGSELWDEEIEATNGFTALASSGQRILLLPLITVSEGLSGDQGG